LNIGEEEIEALKGDYTSSKLFTDAEKAAIRWAEVLTLKQYHGAPGEKPRSAAAMAALKQHYDEAQIVEISMVSGFFNFWNRFTDGLQIDLEEHSAMNLIQRSARVDKGDYIAFMRDCWWNHEGPGSSTRTTP
jgi:hypothetical protein